MKAHWISPNGLMLNIEREDAETVGRFGFDNEWVGSYIAAHPEISEQVRSWYPDFARRDLNVLNVQVQEGSYESRIINTLFHYACREIYGLSANPVAEETVAISDCPVCGSPCNFLSGYPARYGMGAGRVRCTTDGCGFEGPQTTNAHDAVMAHNRRVAAIHERFLHTVDESLLRREIEVREALKASEKEKNLKKCYDAYEEFLKRGSDYAKAYDTEPHEEARRCLEVAQDAEKKFIEAYHVCEDAGYDISVEAVEAEVRGRS